VVRIPRASGSSHYSEFPIDTDLDACRDLTARKTLEKFGDYFDKGVIADFLVDRSAGQEDTITRGHAESKIAGSILEAALRFRKEGNDASATITTADSEEISFKYDSEEDRFRGVIFLQAVALNPSDTRWWSYQTFSSSTRH